MQNIYKFATLFCAITYLSLFQTACVNPANEKIAPTAKPQIHAREAGGIVIVLGDLDAVPTYDSEMNTYVSSETGTIALQTSLNANCREVIVAYRLATESNWSSVWIRQSYESGVVSVDYTLSCLNAESDYVVKIIALPDGTSGSLYATGNACSQ